MTRRTIASPPLAPELDQKILWTAGGIGRRIGCGPDFVRTVLAVEPGSPVKRLGRRLYAFEGDLLQWLRDRNSPNPTTTD
ncbi:hypothetical protein [Aminobacter sp. Piv2-1]|uniref:hypothetical protein n=1 Tax=Aminobacter sp. Piv2-1 TaxID=3031122 RepID=UPI0030A4BC22